MSKTLAKVVLRHIGAKIMMLRQIASKIPVSNKFSELNAAINQITLPLSVVSASISPKGACGKYAARQVVPVVEA